MDTVVIFKEELLPMSETFVKAQAEAVAGYRICYAGVLSAIPSLPLERPVFRMVNDLSVMSRIRLFLYRTVGRSARLRKGIADFSPSLVHAHFVRSGAVILPVTKELGVPLIVTCHGYDVTTHRDQVDLASLFQKGARFLCVSDFIRRKALEAGFPEEKLTIHYIGIDCDKFNRTVDNSKSTNVVFVGRMVQKKGVEYLLEAMKIVQDAMPSATLTLVGDGVLRASLESRARQLQLNCTFLGSRNSAEILAELQSAALLCLPSITADDGDSEGLPITILEAQALELPVVSTYHAGIPEVITHGVNGLLSEEKSVDALAEHILLYLQNPEERLRAGQEARVRVRRDFDLKTQTLALEVIYQEVLREHAGVSRHSQD
jgi:colanic acid/amylovoran biosynthesis glycosyltransferase